MNENHLELFYTRSKGKNYLNTKSSMSDYFTKNKLFHDIYKGTYAMDEFNHIDMTKSNKCLIIFNSITRKNNTMGHWLGLYSKRINDRMIHVTFIDSFGLSISHYNPILQNYLRKHTSYIKKLDFNTFPLQSNNSYVCGAYVCFISHKLVTGLHLTEICNRYFKKNNRKFNDLVVTRFVKNNWYTNCCNTEFCPMKTYESECFNCKC